MVQESPIEVLKMRFAKGEITHEQYREMLSALMGESAGAPHPSSPPSRPSYKGATYIPPVERPAPAPAGAYPPGRGAYSSNVVLILLAIGMFIPGLFWWPLPFLVVILSAIAVYYDAKALGAGGSQKETTSSMTWSPFSWAALVFLLWIIGMPLYLIRRRQIWEQSSHSTVIQAGAANENMSFVTFIVAVVLGLMLAGVVIMFML